MRWDGTYVVTDIELDGLDPAKNSMLSFASVAITVESGIIGKFEANVFPRPDRTADPRILAWWQTQPDAWRAATENQRTPTEAMNAYTQWVGDLPGPRAFAAHPLLFDGPWMDEYLRSFTKARAIVAPFVQEPVFDYFGLDIPSFVSGVCGWDYARQALAKYPAEWTGSLLHTHRAIDDATRYANVLLNALRLRCSQTGHFVHIS